MSLISSAARDKELRAKSSGRSKDVTIVAARDAEGRGVNDAATDDNGQPIASKYRLGCSKSCIFILK